MAPTECTTPTSEEYYLFLQTINDDPSILGAFDAEIQELIWSQVEYMNSNVCIGIDHEIHFDKDVQIQVWKHARTIL